MANKQHIFTTALDPAGAPTGIGHHHVNSATGEHWFSVGTIDVNDWHRAPNVSFGTGTPTTTPLRIGDVYIDTTVSSEVNYTAVHTTDATGWSLGGGGGGGGVTGPIIEDDTTKYTITDTNPLQNLYIDPTTRYHEISVPVAAVNSPSLLINLPSTFTTMPDADGSKAIEFDIVVRSSIPFVGGQSGHFDHFTSIGIQVNGSSLPLTHTDYDATGSMDDPGVSVSSPNVPIDWDFNDVRSYLHFTARLVGSNAYSLTIDRDAPAQLAD